MANESISPSQRAECIKLQAERVVRAYNELRTTAHSADFKNDDFPVGRFAELVQQIKLLDGWLQPADLKARCEALGYELVETDEGEQFVLETHTSPRPFVEVVFIHRNDGDDDLGEWIADREQVSERVRQEAYGYSPREAEVERRIAETTDVDSARDAAQRAAYAILSPPM